MSFSTTNGLRNAGGFFALTLDTFRAIPKRPFQRKEYIQQAWFLASVSILPTALVSIPFGAVIALQVGNITRQMGAQSFTGSASVLAILREASPVVTALLLVIFPANATNGDIARAHAPEGWAPFSAHLGDEPPVCTEGYEGTHWRSPHDTSDAPANTEARCSMGYGSESSVRGSGNAPRPR